MKIERIECILLQVPLPRAFQGINYSYTAKVATVTRVYADNGPVGECYLGDDFGIGAAVVRCIRDTLQPALKGLDPRQIERCWDEMRRFTRTILGDRRVALQAQAAVDMALWDMLGKVADMPLYRMWGGYRSRLPVIAIAGYYEDGKRPADYGAEAEQLRLMGMGGMKLKVGGMKPSDDAARARAIRDAVGHDFRLAVDANQAWTVAQALEFCRATGDLELMWCEEPCHWDNDRRMLAELRARVDVPICAGQSEISSGGCRELMAAGALDICNFHAGYGGGVSEWRRVAGMAQCFGLQLAHTGEPQLSIQLMAAYANAICLEVYHPDRDPLFYRSPIDPASIIDGFCEVPDRAGWGLEMDAAYIKRYTVAVNL